MSADTTRVLFTDHDILQIDVDGFSVETNEYKHTRPQIKKFWRDEKNIHEVLNAGWPFISPETIVKSKV